MRTENHKRRVARLTEQLGRTNASPTPFYRHEWSKTEDGKSVSEFHCATGNMFYMTGTREELESMLEAVGPR